MTLQPATERPQFLTICLETGYFERHTSREIAVASAASYARKFEAEVTVAQVIASVRTQTEWKEFQDPSTPT